MNMKFTPQSKLFENIEEAQSFLQDLHNRNPGCRPNISPELRQDSRVWLVSWYDKVASP